MKNSKLLIALAIIFIGFASQATAQSSATATSSATIVTPIAITKTVDMNFGNVAVTSQSGTVVLPAASGTPTRSTTGGVTLPVITGTVTAAEFEVSGQLSYTYGITLPSDDLLIKKSGSTETMIVNAFVHNAGAEGALDASGDQTIHVGATLNVSAEQAAGTYISETPFTVTVNYN